MDTRRNVKTPPARRRFWLSPPRTLNKLMSAVALSGLAFGALAQRPGVSPAPPSWRPGRTAPPWVLGTPGPAPRQPDPFLVAPREGLDPRFVVAAPQGIDDGMIAPPPRPFAAPESLHTFVVPVPPPGR